MITKGTICIWQNMTGPRARLNGQETTVIHGLGWHKPEKGPDVFGYVTDTDFHFALTTYFQMFAKPHELREKNPPKGEFTDEEEKEDERSHI